MQNSKMKSEDMDLKGSGSCSPLKTELENVDLKAEVKKQMEFYFSESNLRRDTFLRERLQDGAVDINVLLTFNKLKKMTTDVDFIVKAIQDSEIVVVEVKEDQSVGINRKEKLPEEDTTLKRTVVIGGLGKNKDEMDTEKFVKEELLSMGIDVCYYRCIRYKHKKENSYAFSGACTIEIKDEKNMEALLGLKKLKDRFVNVMTKVAYDELKNAQKMRVQQGCDANPIVFLQIDAFGDNVTFRDARKGLEKYYESIERPFMTAENSADKRYLTKVFLGFKSEENASLFKQAIEKDLPVEIILGEKPKNLSIQKVNAEDVLRKDHGDKENNGDTRTIIQFTNVHENTTREAIINSLGDLWTNIKGNKWLDFRKGCQRGEIYVFSKECAQNLIKQIESNPITLNESTIQFKIISNAELQKAGVSYTNGVIIKVSNIQDNSLSREDLKYSTSKDIDTSSLPLDNEGNARLAVAFIDFQQEDACAYLRMATPSMAMELLEKVKSGLQVNEITTLTSDNCVLLTGDVEKAYWEKVQAARQSRYSKPNTSNRNNKRKSFSHHGSKKRFKRE